jgi:hypothetical protein
MTHLLPRQALYPMEILSFEMRAKGLAFLNLCTQGSESGPTVPPRCHT